MVMAFLSINTVPDQIENVLENIKKIDGVEEAYMVYGIFDIIAKIKATDIKELRELILEIRKMSNVSLTSIQRIVNSKHQAQFDLRIDHLSVPIY
jgi:DNA-binding Lrp family transcriptional regulator